MGEPDYGFLNHKSMQKNQLKETSIKVDSTNKQTTHGPALYLTPSGRTP